MAIQFRCPGCNDIIQADDQHAGTNVRCPSCSTVMVVPGPQPPDPFSAHQQTPEHQAPRWSSPPSPQLPESSEPAESAQPSASDPYYDPNPYAVPQEQLRAPLRHRQYAENPLKYPGIFLIALSGAWLAILTLAIIGNTLSLLFGPPPGQPPADAGSIAVQVFLAILQIVVLYGATCMVRQKDQTSIRIGLVVSLIPICGSPCCFLGLPFGIWAMVVLNDPAVQDMIEG